MTIQRGQDWGRRVPKPLGVVEVADDAAAGELIDQARREGAPLPAVGLLGGDMRRTLGGGPGAAGLGAEVAEFTVDLGVVELDGRPRWFLSHLVARRSWWRGEVLAAMNAQFVGTWDVAPRGHPNDGRLDVVHAVDLPLADRWKAWRRLPGGTHLPHPGIVVRQVSALEVDLARPTSIRLDGRVIGSASKLLIRAEPDALVVCI